MAIFLKGICGIIFQTILLREFFCTFFGSEFSFVIVLFFWMAGCGIGSFLFKKVKNYSFLFNFLTIFENVFFILSIFLLRTLRHISQIQFFLPFIISSFFIVFLSGLFEGSRFVLLSSLFKEEKSSGKVYGLEGLGALVGGIIIYFFFFLNSNPFFVLSIISIINLFTFIRPKKFSYFLLLPFLFILFYSNVLENISLNFKWKPFEIANSFYTPYQNIEIVKKDKEIVLSTNGIPEISNQPDIYSLKNIVFFSICFLDKLENVLVVSNPEIIDEIEKYKPKNIYYVDVDSKKIEIIKKNFLKKNYKNLKFINSQLDPFIKKTDLNFDVIFLGETFPLNFYQNTRFTSSFVSHLSKKTKIVSLLLPGNYEYAGKDISLIHSIVYNTFKKHFEYSKFIFTYPFISIFSNVQLNQVNKNFIYDNDFFNPSYIKYTLSHEKEKQYIRKNIIKTNENTINNQFLLLISVSNFLSLSNKKIGNFFFNYFKIISENKNILYFLLFFIFILFLLISRKNVGSKIVFTNGFISFGFESLLIIITQVIFGYVYSKISTLTALFMGGISIGSIISMNFLKKENIFYIEAFVLSFYILSFITIYFIRTLPFSFLLGMIFISGFFVGLEFGLISFLDKSQFVDKTGKLYAFDLLGGSLSSVVIPFLILPIFGLYLSFIIFPVVKLSNFLFLTAGVEHN